MEETNSAPARRPKRWGPLLMSFLAGVMVGVAGFGVYITTVAPVAASPAAIQAAARDGALEALATAQAGGGPAAAQATPAPVVVDTEFAVRDANRAGEKSAPVTVVEFSDFQCPFCGRFHASTEPELLKQYVDSGKVSFVYKHMAILGQESFWAAEAAECAADQGKFWAYHDLLFARQSGENQGAFNKDKLLALASELKLDMAQFEPCLKEDKTLPRVQADTAEGQGAGVSGTPSFFINGRLLVGAQPLDAFQPIIEQALAKK